MKFARKRNEIIDEQAVNMFQKKLLSKSEIGRRLNISPRTVGRILSDYRVRQKRPLISNRLVGDKVVKMFMVNRMTQAQISREIGIAPESVRRILLARNIDTSHRRFSLLECLFYIHDNTLFTKGTE